MSQNTGRRQMANMWKEDFQDLSLFCQESMEQSNFIKSTSIGRGNSTVPDDELNTPEIGVGNEDFNLDSWPWPQPESIDDMNLWDDNTFLKRGYDNIEDERMLDGETFGELPLETNQKSIIIDANVEEDCWQQKDNLSSDVNNKTYDKIYAPEEIIVEEECEIYGEEAIVQENKFSSVVNIQSYGEFEINRNDEMLVQVNISENLNSESHPEIMEVKELALKKPCHTAVTSKIQAMKSSLHLPLTMENTADVLNTPEVLARLESQPEFDLLSFVLEDNPGPGPACGSSNEITHPAPSGNFEIVGKVVKIEDMETLVEENACEETTLSSIGPLATGNPDEHYVVAPSNQGTSEIGFGIKNTQTVKRLASSLKGKSECCNEKTKRNQLKEEVDTSDDDYKPPEKVKRNSRSKRTKSECSRYRELRNRNNEASRRSRQNRKVREEETKSQLATLESDNQRLKIRAEELEKLVDTLRKALLNSMVKGKD